MLLTESNIVHYLLDCGLFDKASFLCGKFSCHPGNSRHKHYIVNKNFDNNRYFIKQALGSTTEKILSLEREGLFYTMAALDSIFLPLQKYLPISLHHDKRNAILVLEYLKDYTSIYDKFLYQQSFDNNAVATAIADALYLLHSIPSNSVERLTDDNYITISKPGILTLPKVKLHKAKSDAENAVLQLIYDVPGFINLIADAAKLWQPTCIVHGDSKLNNFIKKTDEHKTSNSFLKLIDWELFNTGDPLWDVATVFQSALTAWVINEDSVYKINNGNKTFDYGNMQKFISTCFNIYATAHKWNEAETYTKLEKCTSFTALRLLHNCFETTPHAQTLRPYSARLLQLSYNILINPSKAAQQVLGINIYK
jgi:aminoglycoside phosphotransferase (APT) family kinase protein